MSFSGAGALPPLFRLAAGRCFLLFSRRGLCRPFSAWRQGKNFSRSPIFPSLGEERTICLPFSRQEASDLSPLPFGGWGIFGVLSPSPFRGREKRFPETKKRSWSFGQNKRPASSGNEPEKIKATPSAARPRERARGTSLREGGTGVLARPSDQMRSEVRRSLPRSKILASFSSVSSMTGSRAFVFLAASLL